MSSGTSPRSSTCRTKTQTRAPQPRTQRATTSTATHTPKMNRITRTSHRAGASRAVRKHPMACVRPPTTGRNPHVASFVSSQANNKQTVTRAHNRSHQVRHPLAAAQVVSAARGHASRTEDQQDTDGNDLEDEAERNFELLAA